MWIDFVNFTENGATFRGLPNRWCPLVHNRLERCQTKDDVAWNMKKNDKVFINTIMYAGEIHHPI